MLLERKDHQVVLIEGSVTNPQEPVTEIIPSDDLVANTSYSVVVFARSDLWNSSTSLHTFCEYKNVTMTSIC